jgi:Asp/Glu/hydantoin racemase
LDETIAESPAPVGDPKVELGMETLRETPASLSTEPLRRPESESQTPEIKAQEKSAADGPAVDAARASMGQAALGAVGAKIHRATTLARNVEGDVVHRVKKVKEISSVVLDEAGYDPSLRFVLVAAVLFLLFLLIVILNKFIY